MRQIFGYLAATVVIVAFLVAAAGAWVIYYPERAWKIVKPMVISKDIQTSWTSASFDTKRSTWKKWRLNWTVTGFKVDRAKPRIQFQGDLKFGADITLFTPRTEIKIETLEIKSTAPAVFEQAGETRAERNPYEQTEDWRSQLNWINRLITMDKLTVFIPDLSLIRTAGSTAKIKLDVIKPSAKDAQSLEVKAAVTGADWIAGGTLNFKMAAYAAGQPFLNAEVNGRGAKWAMQGQFDVAMPDKQLSSNFKFRGGGGDGAPPMGGTADGQLTITSTQVKIHGRSFLSHLPGGVPDIKGAGWSLDLPLWPGVVLSHLAGEAKVTAPVPLSFIRPETRAILEKNCKCKWPETLTATMDGKVWASHLFDLLPEERPIATLNFKFEPINNSLLVLNLNGELRIVRNKEQIYKYTPAIDANVKLPNFQALKGLLEANRVMVPAPFDILQGSIEATIKTNLWRTDRGLVIPIEAKANLASTEQKVNITSKVSLAIPDDFKSMDVTMDSMINDFIVEMPPLDPIHGFPQLTKDSRLQLSPEDSGKGGVFKLRLMYGLRTAKPGAVRLLSKLARPAIPVTLDLDRTAKGDTLGTVKTEPFELRYLHRSLFVDQLRLIMDDRETADFAADGLIRVENPQYKINIAISGSLRSPLIKLSSEPELSRSDIISVLLYDRTSDQLVSADRETVGSFEAAVGDRAIGLLGLWVFASTPIRSFSYNPLTKVYTATVRLSDSTTASVGTNWEEAAQLEVRKRVTRRWVLTASWAPSDAKEQMGKLVLQWEKRF